MDNMFSSGTFRLKGRDLLSLGGGAENAHQLSLRSRLSWPTVYKYITTPERITTISMDVLAGLLIDGLGLTAAQILDMRFGDLFEYVSKPGHEAE